MIPFLVTFTVYLCWLSYRWYFDAIACAMALELGNPLNLVHGNHLLFGVLGHVFWKIFFYPFEVRALIALQVFCALLSSLALFFLYQLLKKYFSQDLTALLITLLCGLFAGYWYLSLEPTPYPFGVLGLSIATHGILNCKRKPLWAAVGHSIAILGHITHVLWIMPLLYWLYTESKKRIRTIFQYLMLVSVFVTVPYAFVLARVVWPVYQDGRALLRWLGGTLTSTPTTTTPIHWKFTGLQAIPDWFLGTAKFIWATFWPYESAVSIWMYSLTVISALLIGLLLIGVFKEFRHYKRLITFCLIWLSTYAIFFITWEPYNVHYRMADVIPLALLMMIGSLKLIPNIRYLVLATLIAVLFTVNFNLRINPMNDIQMNKLFQSTQTILKNTPDETIFLTQGGEQWLYLLYFGNRKAFNVNVMNPSQYRDVLDALRTKNLVLVNRDAVKSTQVKHLSKNEHPLLTYQNTSDWYIL